MSWARPSDGTVLADLLTDRERATLARSRLTEDVVRRVSARALLRYEVGLWMGVEPKIVRFSSKGLHHGLDHGRPIAPVVDDVAPPHVSVAHCPGLVVVAMTDAGSVGVDAEVAGAAGVDRFDDVAADLPDRRGTAAERTRLWVRKESVLKATGNGLMVDARNVRVTPAHEAPRLIAWGGVSRQQPLWMYDVDPDLSHLVSVSVVAPRRPRLVVRANALDGRSESASAEEQSVTSGR